MTVTCLSCGSLLIWCGRLLRRWKSWRGRINNLTLLNRVRRFASVIVNLTLLGRARRIPSIVVTLTLLSRVRRIPWVIVNLVLENCEFNVFLVYYLVLQVKPIKPLFLAQQSYAQESVRVQTVYTGRTQADSAQY